MRKALILLTSLAFFPLGACGSDADTDAASIATEAIGPAADAETAALGTGASIPLALPKMAYTFELSFRLPAADIVPLQQTHADMCEALGPASCQIVMLSNSGDVDEKVDGELRLAVAADKARGFAKSLSRAANEAGGEAFRANIEGADLSKTLVDTEARLRSRTALRDRLLEVLETRRGTVEELVEAERSVAAVNEEIDAAQSWLREQRSRVAFSRMTISYETAKPGGAFLAPIEHAIGSLGSILGVLLAILIVLGAIFGPLLVGLLGVRRVLRRLRPQPADG